MPLQVAVEANSGEPEGQSTERVGVEAGLLSVYYINLEREPTKLQENAVVREVFFHETFISCFTDVSVSTHGLSPVPTPGWNLHSHFVR